MMYRVFGPIIGAGDLELNHEKDLEKTPADRAVQSPF
jgi:hypothetical protein